MGLENKNYKVIEFDKFKLTLTMCNSRHLESRGWSFEHFRDITKMIEEVRTLPLESK